MAKTLKKQIVEQIHEINFDGFQYIHIHIDEETCDKEEETCEETCDNAVDCLK